MAASYTTTIYRHKTLVENNNFKQGGKSARKFVKAATDL